MESHDVLRVLRLPDAAVGGLFRCGSVVYGTAGPGSDRDYIAVCAADAPARDLRSGPGINVVVFGRAAFAASVAAHNVFALEGLFAPAEHQLKPLRPSPPFRRERARLVDAVRERADADWDKAARRFEREPARAAKLVFHALRVLA
jgi:hypothetical protein